MPATKYLNKIGCQGKLCLPLKMDLIVRAHVTNERSRAPKVFYHMLLPFRFLSPESRDLLCFLL